MTSPLVLTKLRQPRLRQNPVNRPRLISRLNEGIEQNQKLSLITAPPGFGKTTLVSEWLQELERPFAWICLDEEDSDPARFLSLIITALQTIDSSIGRSVQSILHSKQFAAAQPVLTFNGEGTTIHSLVTSLINDLMRFPDPLGLVLDDYHLIKRSPVHQIMETLLEHLPHHFHLVVITREEPPFPLPRMRVRSEVTEIRKHDLRFTRSEAADFLNKTMGLDLSAEAIETLEIRTEGWIAGLQMVALSLEGQNDLRSANLIESFNGSHHFVIGFMAEEVLRQQPEDIQLFIRQTAILDRMCASLCNKITNRTDSQNILNNLERKNLFVSALDDKLDWYRYHNLFREFLLTRLDQVQKKELHRKAAIWYEEHNLPNKAVEHVLASEDMKNAERVITIACRKTFQDGQLSSTLNWINALPAAMVRKNSELATYKGWSLTLLGQREAATSFITNAETSLKHDQSKKHEGALLGLKSYLAMQKGDNQSAYKLAKAALPKLVNIDSEQRTFYYAALLSMGQAQRMIGDTLAAIETFRRATSHAQAFGDELATMGTMEELALLLHIHGQRQEAITLCQQTIDRCMKNSDDKNTPSMLGIPYIILAMMYFESDELTQAHQYVQKGLELCQQLMMPAETIRGKILLSRLLLNAGKEQMAAASMEEASQLASNQGYTRYTRLVRTATALLHLQVGNPEMAVRWIETTQLPITIQPPDIHKEKYLIHPRLLIAQNNFTDAIEVLAEFEKAARENHRIGNLISIHILQTIAFYKLAQREKALEYLEKALHFIEPRKYYREILDNGKELSGLLEEFRNSMPELVNRLLHKINTENSRLVNQASTMMDPISDRELDVLKLIADGLSNREAANILFITEGTVKKHLSHIYSKLGVKNRTQAILQARENGLLH